MRSRNGSAQRRVAGAHSNQKGEWNSARGRKRKRKRKRRVRFYSNASIARWPSSLSLTLSRFSSISSSTFSDPSHFLAFLFCSTSSCVLSLLLRLPLTFNRSLFLSFSLSVFLSSHVVPYKFIGDPVATHSRLDRVTTVGSDFGSRRNCVRRKVFIVRPAIFPDRTIFSQLYKKKKQSSLSRK